MRGNTCRCTGLWLIIVDTQAAQYVDGSNKMALHYGSGLKADAVEALVEANREVSYVQEVRVLWNMPYQE